MTQYIALLRGINVGGHHKLPMAELKKILETLGCKNVKTILASGNVILESDENAVPLSRNIESTLKKKFGFDVPTLVYPKSDIDALVGLNPFKEIEVTERTRLYVTFLRDPSKSQLNIPWYGPDDDFTILSIHGRAVCSVLTLSETTRSTESMAILEREFGKDVTTRNWNTIVKLVQK